MNPWRTRWSVSAAVLALALSTGGCGGEDDSEPLGGSSVQQTPGPTPTVMQIAAAEFAPCYSGEGTADGTKLFATLRLTRGGGDAISGVYVVGETKARGLSYTVTGTLKDRKLDSVFTAAGQGLNVTGSVNITTVHLDDPDGTFSVTRFTAGCS